jgi:FKBP-type peptidyl-prolyl cis-trans isomerase FkpA
MKSICFVGLLALFVGACGSDNSTPTAPSANVPFSTTDIRVGTGTEAAVGRTVTVNYSAWLWDSLGADNKGSRFDSSLAPGRQPLVFVVGTNQLIPGFSQGVQGMRVGGSRRVVIPPSLAYGPGGNPPTIPGNATLIFEMELLAVQ